jgi:hypothetical protein
VTLSTRGCIAALGKHPSESGTPTVSAQKLKDLVANNAGDRLHLSIRTTNPKNLALIIVGSKAGSPVKKL